MSGPRFKQILSVYVMLLQDDQILLLRRFNTGFEDGKYGLVAGHVDANEPTTRAMCREAKEEAGITIQPEDLRFVHFMHRCIEDERADVFFVAEKWIGKITIAEPDKCDDLSWFPLDKLPGNTIPYIRQAIENYRHGQVFSEWGW